MAVVRSMKFVLILLYLLTAIGLTPGGSSTVHIHTQTIHRTTKQLEGFLGFEPRVVKLRITMN